jgi:predicted PurR-regulated permease PerM
VNRELKIAHRELGPSIARTVWSYLRGQFLVMLIMMAVYAVCFWWVEVPLWFLAAFVCGLLHLIPLAGAVIGALIPVAFALIGGAGFGHILRILGIYVAAQVFEGLYLTPKILGRELRISPLLVLLSALIGGFFAGVVGAMLGPLVAAVGLLVWSSTRKTAQIP